MTDNRPLPDLPALCQDDPLPKGPYTVGMLWDMVAKTWTPPWTVRCADGRSIAGWITSRPVAEAIATALNAIHGEGYDDGRD